MLLGTLGASLLGNLLTGKRAIATRQGCTADVPGRGTISAGESTIRAGQEFRCGHTFLQLLKYKSIIKMNLSFMMFNQEIIYQK